MKKSLLLVVIILVFLTRIAWAETAEDKGTKEMVREWVEDLVLLKTFTGLKFQESILKRMEDGKKLR